MYIFTEPPFQHLYAKYPHTQSLASPNSHMIFGFLSKISLTAYVISAEFITNNRVLHQIYTQYALESTKSPTIYSYITKSLRVVLISAFILIPIINYFVRNQDLFAIKWLVFWLSLTVSSFCGIISLSLIYRHAIRSFERVCSQSHKKFISHPPQL